MTDQIAKVRGYVRQEREAALLYRKLAETTDGRERMILEGLASSEEQHAIHWERVLERLGDQAPIGKVRLGMEAWIALYLGRQFGLVGAMPALERSENREIGDYDRDPETPASMLKEERQQADMIRELVPKWRSEVAGTLRAGIFGISDGAVSNLALVIGVFGAGASSGAVVTAGTAGLIAGALSMAVGEFVSVASQEELLEVDSAQQGEGAPRKAAIASLVTFAFGAVVPLLPFLVTSGVTAALIALVAAGALLYTVGAALSLLTLRSAVRTGLRQLGLGWGAALATYIVGLLIGGGT